MANTAKKTARKSTSKKAAANARRPAPQYKDGAKIKVTFPDGEVPAREGTGRYERLMLVKKHNGKTVESFVEHGGRVATLSRAEQNGWVKVG